MRALVAGCLMVALGAALTGVVLIATPIRTECQCWDNGAVKAAYPMNKKTWNECRAACSEDRI